MTNKFEERLGKDMSKTRIGYYIDFLSKIEKTVFDKEFNKIGITYSQFKVLNWIWRYGELTQKEIYDFVKVKPSSLTTMINVLIKKGLVTRTQDPDDARIRRIRATDECKRLAEDAWRIIEEFDMKIKGILTEEEYKCTMNSMMKLTSALGSDAFDD